ncbi:MAG: S8 family serine peptidase [Deltaproteobacteria bacterium]|nr:S8 family serine peptidase [Deltaproteobacteria bacterium]
MTGDIFYVLRVAIASDDDNLRGPWTMQVKLRAGASLPEPVRVHAWTSGAERAYVSSGASPGYKVGSPGAARSAITVGSYATRNEWVTSTSKIYKAEGVALGEASGFSSQGPTRDQRMKPDLSAPGEYVGMAKSSRSGAQPLYQIGQSPYLVNRGTSFSSPYVAGAVAALLQLDPALTPTDVRLFLQGTVDPRSPATQWGRASWTASGCCRKRRGCCGRREHRPASTSTQGFSRAATSSISSSAPNDRAHPAQATPRRPSVSRVRTV